MDVTLLGSGEAVGVPAPLCGCRYCEASRRDSSQDETSQRRRRPALLVETDDATVVLDAGPDLKEQLHRTDTHDVDAFFVTHHHFDHVGGLHELHHAAMGFDAHVGIEGEYLPDDAFDPDEKPEDPEFAVYLTETALGHLRDATPYFEETLDLRTLAHGEAVAVGDLRVVPFPVRHARPEFDTVGFAVYHGESKVVYAPDMWEFLDGADADDGEHPSADEYADADLLVAESAALFRAFGHGEESDLRASLERADADRTVLVNLSEHLQRMSTAEMRKMVAKEGYELGEDFATYRV